MHSRTSNAVKMKNNHHTFVHTQNSCSDLSEGTRCQKNTMKKCVIHRILSPCHFKLEICFCFPVLPPCCLLVQQKLCNSRWAEMKNVTSLNNDAICSFFFTHGIPVAGEFVWMNVRRVIQVGKREKSEKDTARRDPRTAKRVWDPETQ